MVLEVGVVKLGLNVLGLGLYEFCSILLLDLEIELSFSIFGFFFCSSVYTN